MLTMSANPRHSDPAPLDQRDRTEGEPSGYASQPVDADALRGAMRRLASPIVVVTVETDEGPRGATIGSFTSVSLDPPLISFNVTRDTQLHRALVRADQFAVHVLAAEHASLATHFAVPDVDGEEQFLRIAHQRYTDGRPPLLEDTLGVLVCTPESRFGAGDHSIFVGCVTAALPGRDGSPLLYHRQTYRGVGEEV